jgi:hypothetical protein
VSLLKIAEILQNKTKKKIVTSQIELKTNNPEEGEENISHLLFQHFSGEIKENGEQIRYFLSSIFQIL